MPVPPYPFTPHLATPFKLTGLAGAAVVEQDAAADVAGCVNNIVVCPQGFRTDLPDFGIPDPMFQTIPVNTAAIHAAITRYEPRPTVTIIETGGVSQPWARTVEIDIQLPQ